MYHVSNFAAADPDGIAAIFPALGHRITFAELDAEANRAAHAPMALGMARGDCVALSITNRPEFLVTMLGAQRAGLYYVLLPTKLSATDLAYIVADSDARAVILATGSFALENPDALAGVSVPALGLDLPDAGFADWAALVAGQPATPPADASRGREMLYSSGTTGQPKGIRKPLPEGPVDAPDPLNLMVAEGYGIGPGSVFLSPCPLYHAAPHRFASAVLHAGATLVVPDRFEPSQSLAAIGEFGVTHSLWVPTMFHRMLQLPDAERAGAALATHRHAIHGAAPCPVHIKWRMIEWWGPIIDEYYSGSEGIGSTNITSQEWLAHPGSVGRPANCKVHILDPDGNELPVGETGDIHFESDATFEYWRAPEKTRGVLSPQGWRTFGDVGHVDADGYLYLTDRRHFTIISGGVNIYPQEIESALLEHAAVQDAAVIGVANEEFGQEVSAIVQLVEPMAGSPAMADDLKAFVRKQLGPIKTPRSIVFDPDLPRHATGKLYKTDLIRRYG